MRITVDDPRALFCTIRLDGVVITTATEADDQMGYVDLLRVVNGECVRHDEQYIIDRVYGSVSITMHRLTKTERELVVLLPT